jgi:hypothetical protein
MLRFLAVLGNHQKAGYALCQQIHGAMRFSHILLVAALCCAALAWSAGPAGRLLVVLPLLLFGPGYLLERALAVFMERSLALRPALWLGLSLSIVALVYQWTTAFGLSLAPAVLYALAASCGLGVIWRVLRERTTDDGRRTTDDGRRTAPVIGRWSGHDISCPFGGRWSLGLLAILALTFWTRFYQIKDLALPAWVDSVHHALMIRVAAERGQAPYSLRPYLPVDQLPYHWGYHVFAAAVMRLSGMPLGETMLWTGQVLNALQALAVAALAAFLWRRPFAGVVAGLVVGLLSIMPAYYVSWGRYTQLTGMLLLPPLMFAWRAGLHAPSRGRFACVAVLLAGLSLIHFRILVFALAFMAVSGAIWAFEAGWVRLRSRLRYATGGAALALALAAPWLWVIAVRTLLPAVARPQNLVAEAGYSGLTAGLLWAGHNRWLIALALAAALWGVLRRSRVAAEQVGWVAALALLANPALVGLPYTWLITNDVVVISLFIPVGVLLGGGACMLVAWLESRLGTTGGTTDKRTSRQADLARSTSPISLPRGLLVSQVMVIGALALWGAWDMRSVINPDTVLATQADVAAIAWADANTPADARFLVNAAPWLNIQRGADGGWWLLPLAGRWVSAPPILYIYGPPDYVREIGELNKSIIGFRQGQEQQIYDLIDRERITYIYLGARPGPLSAAVFASSGAFEKVYQRDGVTILAVHR